MSAKTWHLSSTSYRSKVSPALTTQSDRSSNFEQSPAQSDTERTSRAATQEPPASERVRSLRRRRDHSRRQKEPEVWKKILWVRQSYPDNYTDPPTFLSHLQWNPRVVPYDFWPLVADSTVIVQHVCSVVIFICCFIGIYQERVSPISVVGWGSTFAFICWLFWDVWIGLEEQEKVLAKHNQHQEVDSRNNASKFMEEDNMPNGLGLLVPKTSTSGYPSRTPSPDPSVASVGALHDSLSPTHSRIPSAPSYHQVPPFKASSTLVSARWQRRLATAKSAILIYCALLGLSPILKSLTISTTSDSIWAMSSWLLLINVFFYDYGGEGTDTNTSDTGTTKYQSSLSTNAALMASTVLASRLTSTTHVFSLTLFSIEVFGLFPVFRRHLRQHSWRLHTCLTVLLILAAGAGLGIVLADPIGQSSNSQTPDFHHQHVTQSQPSSLASETLSFLFWNHARNYSWNWKAALAGATLWGLGNILAMGGCSWWLISLQKYKNVVIGPWDPAKPIVRRGPGVEVGGYG